MSKRVGATARAVVITALVAIASIVTGCGGSNAGGSSSASNAQPVRGGEIEISQGEEVTGLVPVKTIEASSIIAESQIMETLYKTAASGEIEPVLAVSDEATDNQRKWTFHLRPGVKFSNGRPLTAEDVVFSIDLARHSIYYSSLFEEFRTVRATSSDTVAITTKQPVPAMKALLSGWFTAVVPKNYGGVSENEFDEHPIGTGPFVLGKWEHGQSLTLIRNPGYWNKARPYLDKVVLKAAPDPASRVTQLRGGELLGIEKPPFSQLQELEDEPGLNVGIYSYANAQYLSLNSRSAIFQDPKIREAITLAIDRQGIIDTALSGYGKVGGSFLVPPIPFHDPNVKPPARDPQKAKQLVSEAKADGEPSKFTLSFSQATAYAPLAAQIIQQNLEEVGLHVKLQSLDDASLTEKRETGEYEAALAFIGPAVLDPSENVSLYLGTEALNTGADTTQVAKLAAEGAIETDPSRRRQIYYQIQQIVANQHYVNILAYEPVVWGLSNQLAGFAVNPIGLPWYSDVGLTGDSE